ncbi:hypothetical protein MMC17_010153 [Xylographa soralifera]|nr:hypothetical protein [Xylographa soralifera]
MLNGQVVDSLTPKANVGTNAKPCQARRIIEVQLPTYTFLGIIAVSLDMAGEMDDTIFNSHGQLYGPCWVVGYEHRHLECNDETKQSPVDLREMWVVQALYLESIGTIEGGEISSSQSTIQHGKRRAREPRGPHEEDEDSDDVRLHPKSPRDDHAQEPRQNPSPIINIPDVTENKFLEVLIDKTNKGTYLIYDNDGEFTAYNIGRTMEGAEILLNPMDLVLAKDIDYWNVFSQTTHDDDSWRHYAYTMITRYHQATNENIVLAINPSKYSGKDPLRQTVLKKCAGWVTAVQNRSPSFCLPGVEKLFSIMGVRQFQESTLEESSLSHSTLLVTRKEP